MAIAIGAAVCGWLSLSNISLNAPEALAAWPEPVARYLGNDLCVLLMVIFLALIVYAALQGIAAGLDRASVRAGLSSAGQAPRRPVLYGLRCRLSGYDTRWPNDLALASAAPRPSTGAPSPDALDHEEQMRLAAMVYGVWVLPLIGFIGTVIGITEAIGGLDGLMASQNDPSASMGTVLAGLRFAFDTTLLGLIAVIPVMAGLMALRGYLRTTHLLFLSRSPGMAGDLEPPDGADGALPADVARSG